MKKRVPVDFVDQRLTERLSRTGLRFTAQRRHVYSTLLKKRDHPSAEEVFMRAKAEMPDLSMATVYNTLDMLVKCGLVRQVVHERGASRYCSNMQEHHHFHCEECGGTFDIDKEPETDDPEIHMPPGFSIHHFEILFRGVCPECAAKAAKSAPNGTLRLHP
ncbi:MAG: transcriptional repressor [Verrucomicrobiales bacterium]|nr:transcriptional repressor [Verrucomicrobiales bacterium]